MKTTVKSIAAIIAFFGLLVTAAAAAPVEVTADRMESVAGENLVRFSGHVEARQEGLVIRAAEMDVRYRKEAAGGDAAAKQAAVERIVARGGVTLVREGWVATGKELDYTPGRGTAVLTGAVEVRQGNNLVSGERIVLDLESGRTVVERGSGAGGRVRAFFYPQAENGGR